MRHASQALEALLDSRGDALMRAAVLLAGDREAGRDLLQEALERVMRSPSHLRGDPEPYLRRTLYHLSIDRWRRRSRRPEVLVDVEPPAAGDATDSIAVRTDLIRALAQLPARQRAVLVLRFFEDRSEAETADLLGCSIGTVKSTCSRGLAHLRDLTISWQSPERTLR